MRSAQLMEQQMIASETVFSIKLAFAHIPTHMYLPRPAVLNFAITYKPQAQFHATVEFRLIVSWLC